MHCVCIAMATACVRVSPSSRGCRSVGRRKSACVQQSGGPREPVPGCRRAVEFGHASSQCLGKREVLRLSFRRHQAQVRDTRRPRLSAGTLENEAAARGATSPATRLGPHPRPGVACCRCPAICASLSPSPPAWPRDTRQGQRGGGAVAAFETRKTRPPPSDVPFFCPFVENPRRAWPGKCLSALCRAASWPPDVPPASDGHAVSDRSPRPVLRGAGPGPGLCRARGGDRGTSPTRGLEGTGGRPCPLARALGLAAEKPPAAG